MAAYHKVKGLLTLTEAQSVVYEETQSSPYVSLDHEEKKALS